MDCELAANRWEPDRLDQCSQGIAFVQLIRERLGADRYRRQGPVPARLRP